MPRIITLPLALTLGTRLGVYEVIASIGVGGMGEVYRATDTTLGRQVAIKILPDAFASDPDRIDRGDVRMIQRRERLRLAFEPRQAFGVRCERVRQNLDRDLATERRVRRPIHFTHSANADAGDHFVDAEPGAGGKSQG